MSLPLRIMTRQFELITEVDQYSSLVVTRSWHGIGSIELHINRYMRGADELIKGRIIFPYNKLNKACVILHREIELDENGKASENWIVRALSLKAWMGQRITLPPPNTAYDHKQADAETVMLHYANNNVVKPIDADRAMNDVALNENLNRGTNVSWQSRFKNLAEELTEISLFSGIGWNIEIDNENKNFNLKIIEGRDLTVNQSVLPPAIFSPEYNTLSQLSYTESELNYKNYAYVAGQGEGVDRRVLTVGESSGFDRFELFVDARDVPEETEGEDPVQRPAAQIETDLTNRGQQKLAEFEQEVFLEGQIMTRQHERKNPKELVIENELGQTTKIIKDADGLRISPESLDEHFYISTTQTAKTSVSGTNTFGPFDLSKLGNYQNSRVNWVASTPTGTRIIVEYSFDGARWVSISSGEKLPLNQDEALTETLYVRQRFFTNSAEHTPVLREFLMIVNGYSLTQEKVFGVNGLIYEEDFDLGDIVTTQNKGWGVSLDSRITEIKEIYEPSKQTLEISLGNNRPTLISKVKQEIAGMKIELTR